MTKILEHATNDTIAHIGDGICPCGVVVYEIDGDPDGSRSWIRTGDVVHVWGQNVS